MLRPSHTAARCRRFLLLAGTMLLALPALSNEANAGDWMYRRSYFSESLPGQLSAPLVPDLHSRSAYRRPIAGSGFGFAARGGYRYNRVFLRSGNSNDVTIIREDWFDIRQRP